LTDKAMRSPLRDPVVDRIQKKFLDRNPVSADEELPFRPE
jgi:hypothetical protein